VIQAWPESRSASGTIQKINALYLVKTPIEGETCRRDVFNHIRRAFNWLDAWTIEAFNPVYPGRPQSQDAVTAP